MPNPERKSTVKKSTGTRKQQAPKKKTPTPSKKPASKANHQTKKNSGVKTGVNDRRTPATNVPYFPKLAGPSTIAQQHAIAIRALESGAMTTHALRALGVHHPAGRVRELRLRLGYTIDTSLVSSVDSDGYMHHGVALYTLIEVPPQFDLDFGRTAANDSVKVKKGSKK